MKIGIDARFYRSSTGGIGRYTRALIRELAKVDKSNSYIVYLTPEDVKEYNIKAKNFQTKVVNIGHYTVAEQTKFLQILNKENFDLVHFTNLNHPVFYRKKFIVTIHDLTMLLYPMGARQKSLIRRIAFKKVIKNACQKSTKIIAISYSTKKDIIKHLKTNHKKIEVIYEGVDERYKIKPDKKEIAVFRKKYRLKTPYILFISQWRPHKGLPELVKAYEKLREEYNISHKLVLIGKPNPSFPEIIKKVNASKYRQDIITPGFVSEQDLPNFYRLADIFVFPSHYEGFGLPPLEAMASGVPVAASNISSMPEILADGAIFFDPYDISDMADKIYQILTDVNLKKRCIDKGFKVVNKYSWQKMAKKTLCLYEQI